MNRFKIDFSMSRSWPFCLYFRRPCFHHRLTGLTWWEEVDTFDSIDSARAFYAKVKDLPEYLA